LVNTLPPTRPASAGLRRHGWRRAARAPERGRAVFAATDGFTLTEILVALCLILIIGVLAAANMVGIADSVDHQPPAKVLQSTIRQARSLALQRMSPVMLTYNGDGHSFDILDDKGNILEQDPDGVDDPSTTLKLAFTPVEPTSSLGDDPNPATDDGVTYSNTTMSRLLFHASGATAPVKVTLTQDDKDMTYRLDPFSEGPPPRPPTDVPALQ
jgi:prepilin-type N-terminal cleavage/methylation domain-containing protein